MKKTILAIASILIIVSCLAVFTGCGNSHERNYHEHNYTETQVAATCTAEGYNLFTCSECNDSYKGEVVIPKTNHTGVGKCTICDAKFDVIWQNFVNEYGADGVIKFEGKIGVLLTYTDDYDCMLYAITSQNNGAIEKSLTLGYNIYDQKWAWLYDYTYNLSASLNGTGTAFGTFSQWSSRSSSLNCTKKTDIVASMSDSSLLSEVKTLYNEILDCANSKLKECGININMANLGLEN